ncbi:MAG: hypothetical protein HeimC2_09140 [Candidatus Heimdallarchaeota archaeon LC_2]|nr:MAG: hypothetical protein HeimC2_09140 [Candidatus Heimdallarchaeota archaeon LC_2]
MNNLKLSNLFKIKPHQIKLFIILLLISLTLFLISNSFMLTIYTIISFGFVIFNYKEKKSSTSIRKVNELRKLWFREKIEYKLKELDLFSYNISYYLSLNLDLPLDNFYQLELSNLQYENKKQYTIPDLIFSEKELVDQEARISKTLVLIVFVPMVFFFLHSSFQISVIIMLLNAVNTLVLIELGTYQMRHPYTLLGWDKLYHDLTEVKKLVADNPFDLIYSMRDYYLNLHLVELSLPSIIIVDKNSNHSFKQLINVLLDFDPIIREHLLFEFLTSIKDVVVIEAIHKKKWEAYRLQFIYVTTSIILFLAILNSIFELYSDISSSFLNELDIKLMSLTITPFLSEVTIIITLNLIYFLSQPYFNNRDQFKYLIFWGFEYFCIKLVLDNLFIILIS